MHVQDSRPDPEHIFDLIIVGGGITGEGVACDAALGRLSYLTPRGPDFASDVSSKSTYLFYGDLR